MIDRTLRIIILAFASWRLASLLVDEDGPFGVFDRLRRRVGVYRTGEMSQVALAFTCIWCMSVWAALLLYRAPTAIQAIFASSAGAIFLSSHARKLAD